MSLPGALRRAGPVVLLAVVVLGAIGGAVSLGNPRRTFVEDENQFFGRILGRPEAPLPPSSLGQAAVWQRVAGDLDPRLAAGARVLVDVSDTSAFIFTRYPDHYIVNSDRDYLKIVADPAGHFTYLIQAGPNAVGDEDTEFDGILASTTGGHWSKWKVYPVATVYQWIPAPAGP